MTFIYLLAIVIAIIIVWLMIIWLIKSRLNYKNNINFIEWQKKLQANEFKDVNFPVLIFSHNNKFSGQLIGDLDEFASDPDIHEQQWFQDTEMVDSKGQLFTCDYNITDRYNYPSQKIKDLTLPEFKGLLKGILLEKTFLADQVNISNSFEAIIKLFE